MQIKNFTPKNYEIVSVLKVIVTLLSLFFIIRALIKYEVEISFEMFPDDFLPVILIMVLLMIANWTLEARRWQLSLSTYEPIKLWFSLKQILIGLSLNWIFPFTAGDAMARLFPMNQKSKTLAAMMLNRSIMLSLTLIFGLIGAYQLIAIKFSYVFIYGLVIIVAVVVLSFNNKITSRIAKLLMYYQSIDRKLLFRIILISVLRYCVFVLQMFLMLKIFLSDLELPVILGGIGLIFFSRSIFPTLFGGLGVREASGILYFSPFVADASLVILPISLVWVINVVIPSLVGLIPLFRIKFSSYKYVSLRQ